MSTRDKQVLTSISLETDAAMEIGEICRACRIDRDELMDLVREGIAEPRGRRPPEWTFTARDLKRIRVAVRLQRDLHVNTPGAALALELLEQMETLRRRLLSLSIEP